ncbi:hypothetical protein SARC_08355 [Sphaeroforma arctica JP610]|uniref:Uncharacterized protein n=1 Tax=Sphaeroforma arctica JP610 TaxID=667725 RepID=A0A0L0FR52_9EUKA|nr:hypothetical protein SARC_08355 [Sphaeroforma arctica JP610]KNC79245.1 hypothetical protein SARC_08355 [Sphaeroforma arctica JP610]|eukprot:XP_014153147.1 hypothetical protein SARC_08355 [Sphaeroforma arctica JP610]
MAMSVPRRAESNRRFLCNPEWSDTQKQLETNYSGADFVFSNLAFKNNLKAVGRAMKSKKKNSARSMSVGTVDRETPDDKRFKKYA